MHCGLDFGTSNSTLGVADRQGTPQLLPVEDSHEDGTRGRLGSEHSPRFCRSSAALRKPPAAVSKRSERSERLETAQPVCGQQPQVALLSLLAPPYQERMRSSRANCCQNVRLRRS